MRTGRESLRGESSAHCLHGRPEHRTDPIAGVLEQLAPVLGDDRAQHLVVGRQLLRHPLGIRGPPPRRALDVREQERQRLAIRHRLIVSRPANPAGGHAVDALPQNPAIEERHAANGPSASSIAEAAGDDVVPPGAPAAA
jgi:hypothetical protein